MPMKYYNLKKWDKAKHWNEILTFQKIDWRYAQWLNEKWKIRIWHSWEYEKKDWIYYPVEENKNKYRTSPID